MNQLRRWLQRLAERERRRPSLESALLGGGRFAYFRRRLTPLFSGRMASTVAHVVEFTILLGLFAQRGLLASLAFTNAAALIDAFWWGALEVMRRRVREQPKLLAREEVRRWMTASLRMALVMTAAALAGAAWHARVQGWTALEGYLLVCTLRLALDLVLRTLYSGIFAVTRVYRPMLVIVLVDPLGVAVVAVAWRHLGVWAFPAGLALSALVSRGLALYYTLAAYRALRRPIPPLRLGGAARLGGFFVAGVAGMSSRLASVLVLAGLLRVSLASQQLDHFTFSLHLVSPLCAGAANWGRVLYHDWMRVSDELSAGLRRRLDRLLLPLALAVGLLFWLPALGLSSLMVGFAHVSRGMLSLAPFFLAVAWLSAQQLRRFAFGEFRPLLLGSLFLCASVALALAAGGPDDAARWNLILAALLVAGTLVLARLGSPRPSTPGLQESFHSWMRALVETPGAVAVGWVNLDAGAAQRDRIATRLAQALGARGAVVDFKRRLHWFEPAEEKLAATALVAAAGGRVTHLKRAQGSDGAAALEAALAAGMCGKRDGADAALPSLIAEFRALFPSGLVGDLGGRSDLRALEPWLRRRLWRDAVRSAQSGKPARGQTPLEVTSYRPAGEIQALFAAPIDEANHEARVAWRRRMDDANWAACVPRTPMTKMPEGDSV